MKFHSKIKKKQKLGFRTPDNFKGKTFRGINSKGIKLNPAQTLRTQHRG